MPSIEELDGLIMLYSKRVSTHGQRVKIFLLPIFLQSNLLEDSNPGSFALKITYTTIPYKLFQDVSMVYTECFKIQHRF